MPLARRGVGVRGGAPGLGHPRGPRSPPPLRAGDDVGARHREHRSSNDVEADIRAAQRVGGPWGRRRSRCSRPQRTGAHGGMARSSGSLLVGHWTPRKGILDALGSARALGRPASRSIWSASRIGTHPTRRRSGAHCAIRRSPGGCGSTAGSVRRPGGPLCRGRRPAAALHPRGVRHGPGRGAGGRPADRRDSGRGRARGRPGRLRGRTRAAGRRRGRWRSAIKRLATNPAERQRRAAHARERAASLPRWGESVAAFERPARLTCVAPVARSAWRDVGFDAEWLAARGPYDEAALDRAGRGRHSGLGRPTCRLRPIAPVVVDLGSGTGAALDGTALARPAPDRRLRRRPRRRLLPRQVCASTRAVLAHDDADRRRSAAAAGCQRVARRTGRSIWWSVTLWQTCCRSIGWPRGWQRCFGLAALAHLALTYDGLTAFEPTSDAALAVDADLEPVRAFHRPHGSRRRRRPNLWRLDGRSPPTSCARSGRPGDRARGPSQTGMSAPTTGRRSGGAGPTDPIRRRGRTRVGGVSRPRPGDLGAGRRRPWKTATLVARVGHRDVLARKPLTQRADSQDC